MDASGAPRVSMVGERPFQGHNGRNFSSPPWRTTSSCGLALTYGNAYADDMTSTNASEAREKLFRLLDETASDHEPGPRSNAVLVSEEDWNSIQETLYLLFHPRHA